MRTSNAAAFLPFPKPKFYEMAAFTFRVYSPATRNRRIGSHITKANSGWLGEGSIAMIYVGIWLPQFVKALSGYGSTVTDGGTLSPGFHLDAEEH